jgi:hypothetical protein
VQIVLSVQMEHHMAVRQIAHETISKAVTASLVEEHRLPTWLTAAAAAPTQVVTTAQGHCKWHASTARHQVSQCSISTIATWYGSV